MPTVHDRRRALISELEALGDAGRVLAKELADLYRAREMAGLNRDMYDAAAAGAVLAQQFFWGHGQRCSRTARVWTDRARPVAARGPSS